jgi:hypothetical protein
LATRKTTTSSKEKEEHQGPAPDPTQALSAAIALFDEDFEKLNLRGKIATISGYLGRIPKNGYNKYNDYWYVLESDLVEAIRYYLAAARILIYVKEIRLHEVYTFETSNQPGQRARDILTDNIYVFEVADGRTAESFTYEANGQGSDPRDKGSNKASTGAMKFGYLRLFNIASGEDEPEGDEAGDARVDEAQRPVTVTAGSTPAEQVQRGGKQEKATNQQIKAISNLSNQLQLGALGLVGVIKRILDDTVELPEAEAQHGAALAVYLKEKSGEDVGKLIFALNEMVKAAATTRSEDDTADASGPGY